MSGLNLIKKAKENELDGKIWEMWIAIFPQMDKKTFISYQDYKNKLLKRGKKKQNQTQDEMLTMVKMLNAAYGGEVVVGTVKEKPFLHPAADESESVVVDIIAKSLNKALEQMGGKK